MQTYAHILPEVQKQVATKMDEILAPRPVATIVANQGRFREGFLMAKWLILWCARHDSNMRPSGS